MNEAIVGEMINKLFGSTGESFLAFLEFLPAYLNIPTSRLDLAFLVFGVSFGAALTLKIILDIGKRFK